MPTRRFSGVGFADDDEVSATEEGVSLGDYQAVVLNSIPSVLERVHRLIDAEDVDPARLTDADAREILSFCAHHDTNADKAVSLTAPGSHEVKAARGLWQNILLNLRNYEEGDPEPARPGRIPIAEIHVPGIIGCECKYKQESATSTKVGLTVTIRGLGGGGGKEATITISDEVASPTCGQVTIPGTYQVTPWTNRDYRSRIDLVTFTDFRPESIGLRDIPPRREHLCSPGVAARLDELQHTGDADFATHPLDIPQSVLTRAQRVDDTRELTLTVDDILEVTSRFTHGFSYEWKIVGAANYLRFFENSRSHVLFWCWDENEMKA